MRYLVTGGAGFIGSHLSNKLLEKGHEVRVLDNLSFGDKNKLHEGIELLVGDVQSKKDCMKATDRVDGIFHMAAFSRSGPSFDKSEVCHDNNVTGTLNILNAAVQSHVKRVVYSGSSTYYGNTLGAQKEDMPGDFLNFYGLTKYIGELYVSQFHRNYGLEFNTLRYFNVYGPGQPTTGEYALVLGIFLNRLRNGQKLEIHGSGEQRRDFIHVYDVVEANIKAMESNVCGEIFNIGSGVNHSINEIAKLFPLDRYYTEKRSGDAEETLANIEKAIQLLNWKPEITINEGLASLMKNL
ncbi:MAG: NAD-dependent epimerase/dehydratase family protein [Candidatus Paceibacterota bacterium]